MKRLANQFVPDIRVNLFLSFMASLAIIIYKSEISFFGAFIVALLFLMFQGKYKKAVTYLMAFSILLFLSRLVLGITALQSLWLLLTVTGRLLIPLSFLSGLSERPTGMILEVFRRLGLPKSFGISTIILLRFMPTLRYELNAIRGCLKFRGVGLSLLNTLFHPVLNFHLTLIPLLVRTVRISDEITAAALTRGLELDHHIVSFYEVKWSGKDSLSFVLIPLSLLLLGLIEIRWGWKFW